MKRGLTIESYLRPLADAPLQTYLTNTLQVADVVEWVLQQVGKSTIWQTSFSISEEFLRRLFFIEKSGKVDKINLILDFKATNKTLRLWPFLTRVIENTYLADNHSKVILIEAHPETESNPKTPTKISIITSQNLTRGNRMESAIVTTDAHTFDTLKASINDLITNHSVPLSELFRSKIGE